MRLKFRHRPVQAAIALLGAGIITSAFAVAPASADVVSPSGSGGSTCTWQVEALPMPEGFTEGGAYGANDQGVFVGEGNGPNGESDLLVWRDQAVEVLDAPARWGGGGTVNERGVILGYDDLSPVVWVDGEASRLALPDEGEWWVAEDMNNDGTVVGSRSIDGHQHGLAWSAYTPDEVTDLGTVDGQFAPLSVNDSGQIFGSTRSDEDGATWRAVGGTVADGFTYLAGVDPQRESSVSTAVGSYVLGYGTPVGGTESVPLLWHDGVPSTLPFTSVASVNSKGVVVGTDEDGNTRVLQDGELSAPLPTLTPGRRDRVARVTESGVLVGWGATAPWGWPWPAVWTCS